ncbi:MAG: tRNA glutamyl-Q(34) synthetase GluQRS [Betaproteobacteria bacterium]|nr:tRNA glutamyl-Q(34) synthetase GluQRS [Betaproteobacteria bacterium]
MSSIAYRGRFAPSPTGPLHFGSLVAAMGSWLDARAKNGAWLLRIEDLDQPREEPGAVASIRATLEACALEWDGEIAVQSGRNEWYAAALQRLKDAGAVFPCACSRREIADSSTPGLRQGKEAVYPGTCRHGLPAGRSVRAWRVRVEEAVIEMDDAVQGRLRQQLATEVGDFVVLRADGCFAYQLAVVADDAAQGITHVVRGADLIDSTPRQVHLQRLLGYATPRYAHLPVALNAAGEKLSKQTLATPLDPRRCASAMVSALEFLGQAPPTMLSRAAPREILDWGRAHWSLPRVPRVRARPVPGSAV